MTNVAIHYRERLHFVEFTEDRYAVPRIVEAAGDGYFFTEIVVTDVLVAPPTSTFFFNPGNIVVEGDRSPSASWVGQPLGNYQNGNGIVISPKNGFLFENWGGGDMTLFRIPRVTGTNRPGHPTRFAYFGAGQDYRITFELAGPPVRVQNLVDPDDV